MEIRQEYIYRFNQKIIHADKLTLMLYKVLRQYNITLL